MEYEIPNFLKNVPRETIDRLIAYQKLLLQWNERINLIGDSADTWHRHILDSAQLMAKIPHTARNLIDMGSGAGLPGLVLSILGIPNVHLAESDTKKGIFLQEAARLTHAPVTIHNQRIESLDLPPFDVITSRALAPLNTLLSLAQPLLHADTICLFPKGKNHASEISDARKRWEFELEIAPSFTSSEGAVLMLSNLRNAHEPNSA